MKVKHLIEIIICCCSILGIFRVEAQDNIACLGNGSLAVYQDRADIIQVFGPPYSAPSAMQVILDGDYQVISNREPGRAIWHHELIKDDKEVGSFTDFVVDSVPGFIREIHALDTIDLIIYRPKGHVWIENRSDFEDLITRSILCKTPSGSFYYGPHPITQDLYHQLFTKGNIRLAKVDDSRYRVTVYPGEGHLYITGGMNYRDNILHSRKILSKEPGAWLNKTRRYWDEFTGRRINFKERLDHFPDKERLLETIDNVAILLKTQQSAEGAVIAGHNFHMGYVRDQYGVSRGLLTMGYHQEAKDILKYYWSIWQKHGHVKNAQGVGMYGFHVHENDEVEVTGYLTIQAFDYLNATGDHLFLKEISPMLEWCWESQKKHLIKDMLPFNGDETYIAGHILPRSAINDGSSEATLLFITGGELFLDWITKQESWEMSRLNKEKVLLEKVKAAYPGNFIDENGLMTNNPARTLGEELPEFRRGVCEARLDGCEVVDWTRRNENDRYLCPFCFPKTKLERVEKEKYYIQSVTLTPFYIHSDLFNNKQKELFINELVNTYQQTKRMPSRPDGNITVGYDYGLFLYALTKQQHPLKNPVYSLMMEALDNRGVWIEYYIENRPVMGTRYRPWESGINIDAAIHHALLYKQ